MWSWSTEGTGGSRSDQYSPVDARHLPLGGLGLLAWVACRSVFCWWSVSSRQSSFTICFFSGHSRVLDVTPSVRSSREEPPSLSCCRPRPFNSLGQPTLNLPFHAVSSCSYLNNHVRVCPDATATPLHDTIVAERSTGRCAPAIVTLQFPGVRREQQVCFSWSVG